MVFRSIAFAAALVLSAEAGTSAAAPKNPIVKSVVEEDLRQLVIDEGHTVDEMHPFDAPSVRGKTSDGLLFVLIGTACDKNGVPGCQGVMMQIRYDDDERVNDSVILDANLKKAAVTTWWDKDDKTVGFTRYVVLDDGITKMNLRQNLRVMLSVTKEAVKIVWP